MRMLVAGGGTGGHFFPGLAVAQSAQVDGDEVFFIGSTTGIEARVVPSRGLPFVPLEIQGARGSGWRGFWRFSKQFPIAFRRARDTIRSNAIDLVLGLGGYGSVPVVLAASTAGIPAVLLEQNAYPGLANRMLSRFAARVCTTFPESEHFFPSGKSILTGNPVRVLASSIVPDPDCFTIFVFGGSQGARSINRAAVAAMPRIAAELGGKVRVLHQTGRADRDSVDHEYRRCAIDAQVSEFIDDMASAYARADLILCRAGATTLAELAAVGRPAILVPYPYAADDHQRHNAESLVARGAADMILDKDLDDRSLAEKILLYARSRERLTEMTANICRLATPEATAEVLRVCRSLAHRN